MKVSLEAIKTLRERTGAPLGNVRAALEQADGDEKKASEILKEKGFEAARKRQERATTAGRVEAYIHHDGRVGALVELNCETDFVARTPEFQQFCRDVAMQVASQHPLHLKAESLTPQQLKEAETQSKTPQQLAKEACLLDQPFIKDQGQNIGQYLTAMIAKTGENVVIRRFARFALGEKLDGHA
jgi:elongation factor Ts